MASTLALDGGSRVVPEGMAKTWPIITDADRESVLSVLDSDPLQLHTHSAPKAVEIQEKWAEYVGTKYCIVSSSGTSALHMCVAAARVEPGDEVITAAFSFWATAAAVLQQNAIPIFVDMDPKAYTMDPTLIEERITDRTKAILPVHIHGMPADMDPINEIAKKHGLVVLEDACQAHGATYKGRQAGCLGDMAGFSCNRSKCLTGGEGGLWTSDNEDYYRHAFKMTGFGKVEWADERDDHAAYGLGWGYRPHELVNALILSQLVRLDENNAKRRAMADFLTTKLAEIPGVAGPHTPEYAVPAYFTYAVQFRPEELGLDVAPHEWRDAAQKALAAEGVGVGAWQSAPVPGLDVFQDRVGYGKGFPWTSHLGRGDVHYDVAEYPRTNEGINAHCGLPAVYPPNDLDLMELYVDGFAKISENAERVIELAKEQVMA